MPRIRKSRFFLLFQGLFLLSFLLVLVLTWRLTETSRRMPTRMRAKIHKKAQETNRKAKRDAKRDPTWKSKSKKDPGVPSLFPFKDQLIQEAQEARRVAEESRAANKLAREAAQAGLTVTQDAVEDGDEEYTEDTMDITSLNRRDNSLKTYARSLRSVIESSDVVIQVLDARDPLGTRIKAIERDVLSGSVHPKKLVLVLNKIDMVPKENVEGWLKYLRRSFPTFPLKSSTQQQRRNLGSSKNTSASDKSTPSGQASSSTAPLLSLLKNYARAQTPGLKAKTSITIGVIGFPNVGKSSLINTLKRSKACGVAPTPGYTKEVQIVHLDGGLKILDSPGVVLDNSGSAAHQVLRNVVKVESIDDPITPVEVIVGKCQKEHLTMLYNITAFNTSQEFLIAAARAKGRLKKGGVPDLPGTARMVLRDWNSGRIPYYTIPPKLQDLDSSQKTSEDNEMQTENKNRPAEEGDKIVKEFAPAFDLDALFAEADAANLKDLKPSSEMKNSVRMKESVVDVASNDQGIPAFLGQKEIEDEMEDDDDAPQLADISTSSKRGLEDNEDMDADQEEEQENEEVVSVAPRKKKVNFTGMQYEKDRQMEKMFGEDGLNIGGDKKALKKATKAAKKKQNRETRKTQEDNESAGGPQAYDFTQFFGAAPAASEDVDM